MGFSITIPATPADDFAAAVDAATPPYDLDPGAKAMFAGCKAQLKALADLEFFAGTDYLAGVISGAGGHLGGIDISIRHAAQPEPDELEQPAG